jgi:hypothetical protein
MGWLEAIGGVAAIVSAAYGVFRWLTWKFKTTPEAAKEEVDRRVDQEQIQFEQDGRPK